MVVLEGFIVMMWRCWWRLPLVEPRQEAVLVMLLQQPLQQRFGQQVAAWCPEMSQM